MTFNPRALNKSFQLPTRLRECLSGPLCATAILKMSPGMTASSKSDDMQSITISQSEPELTNHHAEVDVKKIKKKGHYYLLKTSFLNPLTPRRCLRIALARH